MRDNTGRLPVAGLALASALSFVFVASATAHHSGASYDTTRQVELAGIVKEFRWANPHVWVDIAVESGAGPAVVWHVEAGSLGMMARTGWTRESLKVGDRVTLTINPVRSGDPAGALFKVALADGRVLGGGVPTPALQLPK